MTFICISWGQYGAKEKLKEVCFNNVELLGELWDKGEIRFGALSVRKMRGLQYIGAGLQYIGAPKFYFQDSGRE